jgi:hypothetical protein
VSGADPGGVALRPHRAFFANRRDVPDEAVARAVADVQSRLGPGYVVVSGKQDFESNFARCGGWTEWARDVATGTDYLTREPRYHLAIVPDRNVGRATAQIVEEMLRAGKRVLYWPEDGQPARVRAVHQLDDENWRSGWSLELDPVDGRQVRD